MGMLAIVINYAAYGTIIYASYQAYKVYKEYNEDKKDNK